MGANVYEPVTLALSRPDGDAENFSLPGPGGKFQFSVGAPGERSGVWTVTSPKNKSDVYVMGRTIGGVQKFSLHESGDWRHQWVTREAAERFTGAPDRILDRWVPPAEFPIGLTRGLTFFVPHEDVVVVPDDQQSADEVLWLPLPGEAKIWAFHIVIARVNLGEFEITGGRPIEAYGLADGRVVLLILGQLTKTQELGDRLSRYRPKITPEPGHDAAQLQGLRMSLFAHQDDGSRVVWDLSLVPRPGGRSAPDEG